MSNIIIASGPVIVEDGKVLLNKHGDTTFWKFCGGKVKNGDDNLFVAAKRRAREEVGVDLELLNEEPFFSYTTTKEGGEKKDVILVHFLAKRVGEVVLGEDIRESGWLEINSLPNDLAPNIIPALKHFGFLN
jgi:ADP-ribose pyrophosphatase YjhB (NUDIX family)